MQYRIPTVNLREFRPELDATKRLTSQFCERRVVLPVAIAGDALIVAMVDPENDAATIAEMATLTDMKIEPVRASAEEIRRAIADCYPVAN